MGGVQGNEDAIVATTAIQTHMRWIKSLSIQNCFIAPEVWDFQRLNVLAQRGACICDVMFSLSVVHHIDNISIEQYTAVGLTHVKGTLTLMAKLLELARLHFIELPDRPWISHIHDAFSTPREFLEAAARMTGRQWHFVGPLCTCQWYGRREVWLLVDQGPPKPVLAQANIKNTFPRLL